MGFGIAVINVSESENVELEVVKMNPTVADISFNITPMAYSSFNTSQGLPTAVEQALQNTTDSAESQFLNSIIIYIENYKNYIFVW